jgi:hypothetical protein
MYFQPWYWRLLICLFVVRIFGWWVRLKMIAGPFVHLAGYYMSTTDMVERKCLFKTGDAGDGKFPATRGVAMGYKSGAEAEKVGVQVRLAMVAAVSGQQDADEDQ